MAIDTTQLADYAWTDIQKAAKHAMMSAALGGATLTINGRQLGRITTDQAITLYKTATDMIAVETAGATGGGNVLVRFGDAQ